MMDRKTIWIVLGALILLIGARSVIDKLYPPVPKKALPPAAESAKTGAPPARVEAPILAPAMLPVIPPATAEPRPDDQTVELTNDFVRVVFTRWGGGIRSVELLRHRADGGGNINLNSADAVPALALLNLPGADAGARFEIEQPGARTVVMRTRTPAGLSVSKTFTLGNDYIVDGTVEVSRETESGPVPTNLTVVVGAATPANEIEPTTYLGLDLSVGGKYQQRPVWDTSGVFIFKKPLPEKKQFQETVPARWVAVKSQFFTMIVTPSTNAVGLGFERQAAPKPADWKSKVLPQVLTAWITMPPRSVDANGTEKYAFSLYAGPKEYDRLAALGSSQEEVMQFGMWGVISVVLLRSMKFCYNLIPNYGIVIILLTIVIKIVFWPIQAKSMKSMKAMQTFQPLMAKLREKYKDDAQRLNQEMMKLYKEHKINPFAGCLPMLVQIPVFFALFAMLRSAIELRGAHFLWIKDLSQPDTIFHVPGPGFPVNPLPLAMGVTMLWQMKLTPSAGDPKQQQMMMFMPLVFLFICYNMSSGLVLYWTVQQVLSIAQQWWSLRQTQDGAQPKLSAVSGKGK